jgi:hypothetical protein
LQPEGSQVRSLSRPQQHKIREDIALPASADERNLSPLKNGGRRSKDRLDYEYRECNANRLRRIPVLFDDGRVSGNQIDDVIKQKAG